MLPFALVSLLVVAAPSPDGWTAYVNERFGYSVEVPPGLVGQGEAQNGDGQEFQDASGQAHLKVWGTLVVDLGGGAENRTDLAWARRATLEDWRKQGVRITYQPKGQGWWVLSGETPRGRVLYRKQWERLGVVYGLEWSHPKGARGWQDATDRIARGFKRP